MAEYTGPNRRVLPRGESLPNPSVEDKILMKLDVLRRVLIGGYLDREDHPPAVPSGGSRA